MEEIQQPIDKINNNLDKAEKLFAAAYDVTIIQPGIGFSFGTNWFYIYYFFFHKILKKMPYRIKKSFLPPYSIKYFQRYWFTLNLYLLKALEYVIVFDIV